MKFRAILKNSILNPLGLTSPYYSQGQEDRLLNILFHDLSQGTYVDVGAHDPVSLSNTYFLYSKGWKGICLDPNDAFSSRYREVRPRDTLLHIAASDFEGEAGFNFGKYDVHSSLKKSENNAVSQKQVKVRKLASVLDEHNINPEFEFLSIDTEGTELDVLKGLNLKKYRPKNILVEYNTAGKLHSGLQPFLIENGYQVIMVNAWNMLFSSDMEADLSKLFSPGN